MGSFLDKPVTDKETIKGEGNDLLWGCSAMQGWRVDMEVSLSRGQNCVTAVWHLTSTPFDIMPPLTAACGYKRRTIECGVPLASRGARARTGGHEEEDSWVWFAIWRDVFHFGRQCLATACPAR